MESGDNARKWIEERLAKPYARDLFGIELVSTEQGRVVIALPYREALSFRPGAFQGAITTAMAEYAAAWSAASLLSEGWSNLTIDQTIHFTGAAEGDRLVAEGSVISPGRSVTISKAEVFVEKGGARTLCAVMTQTNRHAPPRP
jgi:uncharacterized protein (TIGR00369 family)